MNPLYDQTFVGRELFYIDFDYDKCMQEPFYNELYNIFSRAKRTEASATDCRSLALTFDIYLHAAHKACGYMMLDLDIYGPRAYHDLFTIAFRYMCVANEDDDYSTWPDAEERPRFNPTEVCLIAHLAYAILAAKTNPSAPFQLIEVFEDHLTIPADITECLTIFCAMRDMNPDPRGFDLDVWLRPDWETISRQLFAPIKDVAVRYSRQVTIDTQLHAHDIDCLSDWESEDLTPWVCLPYHYIGNEQLIHQQRYDAEEAHRFLHHWDDYDNRHAMVQLIEAWSKENPECFDPPYHGSRRHKVGDIPSANLGIVEPRRLGPDPEEQEQARAQAIAELYAYIEELDRENHLDDEDHAEPDTPMPVAAPMQRPPIHLNLDGKEGRTKVNVIRIFNVMHSLGFFVDDSGQPMTKHALFAALSTALNAPGLSEYGKHLFPSRSKALSDHTAQKKIFEKMKGDQEKFINEMKKKHEKELDEELLDIFNSLHKEQLAILDQSDEKKSKQK